MRLTRIWNAEAAQGEGNATPAHALPPLPPPRGLTPQRLIALEASRRSALTVPSAWIERLEHRGWLFAGTSQNYIFLEMPGYWLRIFEIAEKWVATVMPERFRVPRPELGDAGYFLPFPDDMQAPECRGKGARARALEAARLLWERHGGYLSELGIELSQVGVRQFRGSGAGGHVDTKTYRLCDLETGEQ